MPAMEAVLATIALLFVIGLSLVLLSRAWVRSSRLGGYRVSPGSEGREGVPRAPEEDDDVHWRWGDDHPER